MTRKRVLTPKDPVEKEKVLKERAEAEVKKAAKEETKTIFAQVDPGPVQNGEDVDFSKRRILSDIKGTVTITVGKDDNVHIEIDSLHPYNAAAVVASSANYLMQEMRKDLANEESGTTDKAS